MSADLSASADLYASIGFRQRVRAAVTEHAAGVATSNPPGLRERVLTDPESVTLIFAALCAADQAVVDAYPTPPDDTLRDAVANRWQLVEEALGL